jgi:hypothetical protein
MSPFQKIDVLDAVSINSMMPLPLDVYNSNRRKEHQSTQSQNRNSNQNDTTLIYTHYHRKEIIKLLESSRKCHVKRQHNE